MSIGPSARTSNWQGIAHATSALFQTWRTDWGNTAAVALVAYVLLYTTWTAAGWGGAEYRVLISDLAFIPVTCLAALLAWRAAGVRALDRATRSAWRIIAAAFLCYWLGDLQFIGFELIVGQKPFPSSADVAYVAYYGLLTAGLLRFPRNPGAGAQPLRLWLDAATMLLGGGAVVWYLVLGPALLQANLDPMTIVLTAAYPLGDLLLLFGVTIVLLSGAIRVQRLPLYTLVGSLLLFVAADLIYGAQQVAGGYQSGSWIDVVFVAAQAMQGIAAQMQFWLATRPGALAGSNQWDVRIARTAPYLGVVGTSAFLLFAVAQRDDPLLSGLTLVAVGLTWVLIARQSLILRESARQLTTRATQTERLQQIHEAAMATVWETEAGALMHRVLDDARRFTGASNAALLAWDGATGVARLVAATFPVEASRAAACLRVATRVAQHGEEIHSADLDEPALASLRTVLGAHSYAAAPVRGAHEIAGVLLVVGSWGDPRLGTPEVEVLRLLAATASVVWRTRMGNISVVAESHSAGLLTAFSEETRTLLTKVEDDLILLAGSELAPAQRQEVLTTTYRSIHALTHLLDELDMSDVLDRGGVVLQLTSVDAVAVAIEVAQREQPAYGERLIRVLDRGDRPRAQADPEQLRRMLTILLTNTAAHHRSRSAIDLVIGRRPGEVLFEVRDEGIGLSRDEQPRVWERLYRPAGRRSAAQSLGLGLALLKGLVDLHGGDVWVDSHATHTRVGFWLPQATSVAQRDLSS